MTSTLYDKLSDAHVGKGDGAPADVPLFDFRTFCEMIGFEEAWAVERTWGTKG